MKNKVIFIALGMLFVNTTLLAQFSLDIAEMQRDVKGRFLTLNDALSDISNRNFSLDDRRQLAQSICESYFEQGSTVEVRDLLNFSKIDTLYTCDYLKNITILNYVNLKITYEDIAFSGRFDSLTLIGKAKFKLNFFANKYATPPIFDTTPKEVTYKFKLIPKRPELNEFEHSLKFLDIKVIPSK